MAESAPDIMQDPTAEPTQRVGKKFIAILALANLGIWTAFFTPIQFLLPLQVEAIDAGAKESNLALVTAVGALISLVASPLAGAFSDRTSSKLGRRRPWVLWPTIAAIAVLLIMPMFPQLGALVVGWALAQLTLNASYAAVTAMLPDQVPVEQRGTVSAIVGAAQPLGVVVGSLIVGAIPQTGVPAGSEAVGGQYPRYVAVVVVLAITSALFVWGMREAKLDPAKVPAMQWGPFLKSFWISPKEHPDFAWVWITRFLVVLGTAFVTSYLLYFTRDVLGQSPTQADKAVAGILQGYIVTLLIFAVIIGPVSDKVGRIKPFVIGASIVCSTSMVILAFARDLGMVTVAAAIMGAGFGAYTAVDLALISRVLPNPEERAKDLGVVNIANALPQVLAPVLAGVLIGALKSTSYDFAYQVLYLCAAAVTLLGAVLVVKIKSVP